MKDRRRKNIFAKLFRIGYAIYQSTGLIVWVTGFLMAGMMLLQYIINIPGVLTPPLLLPLDTMAWGLTVIASGYVGTDRIASFTKTQALQFGQTDFGDIPKLRRIIFFLLILIVEALVLLAFFKVPNAPLNTLILAFSGAGSTYVIGNKAVKVAASIEGTHDSAETANLLSSPTVLLQKANQEKPDVQPPPK